MSIYEYFYVNEQTHVVREPRILFWIDGRFDARGYAEGWALIKRHGGAYEFWDKQKLIRLSSGKIFPAAQTGSKDVSRLVSFVNDEPVIENVSMTGQIVFDHMFKRLRDMTRFGRILKRYDQRLVKL